MTTTTAVVKVVDMSTGAKTKGGSEVVDVAIAHMLTGKVGNRKTC